jgi:hypothetical protein
MGTGRDPIGVPGVGGDGARTPERPDGPRIRRPETLRERRRLQPPLLAKAAVSAASWQLPPVARSRYRLEFFAEMYGMERVAQVRYGVAVLGRSWRLAAALKEPDVVAMGGAAMRRDIRCVCHLHHYVRRYSPEGDWTGGHNYEECTRCGKFRDVNSRPSLRFQTWI